MFFMLLLIEHFFKIIFSSYYYYMKIHLTFVDLYLSFIYLLSWSFNCLLLMTDFLWIELVYNQIVYM